MSVQEWLADSSPAPSRDSEGVRAAWRGEDPDEGRNRCAYTIQRCAPIKTFQPDHGRQFYPWGQMEPTDHFLVEAGPEEARELVTTLGNAGRQWTRNHRPDMTIRTIRVRKGVRVYMVEAPEDG